MPTRSKGQGKHERFGKSRPSLMVAGWDISMGAHVRRSG